MFNLLIFGIGITCGFLLFVIFANIFLEKRKEKPTEESTPTNYYVEFIGGTFDGEVRYFSDAQTKQLLLNGETLWFGFDRDMVIGYIEQANNLPIITKIHGRYFYKLQQKRSEDYIVLKFANKIYSE